MGELTIHRRDRAFVLMEVLVAMVIVAIAMTGLLRGFVLALDTVQKIYLNETAIILGKSVMDDLILEPPAEGEYELQFADDPRFGEAFMNWSFQLEIEADEPDYDQRPPGKMLQELEEIYIVDRLSIFFEDDFGRREVLRLHTLIIEPDLFSQAALQQNQLFW